MIEKFPELSGSQVSGKLKVLKRLKIYLNCGNVPAPCFSLLDLNVSPTLRRKTQRL
jgi:hypothetical protein